jgi:hypothetical protein
VETMISASSGIAPASGALGAHDAPEWCSRCAGITAHDAPEYATWKTLAGQLTAKAVIKVTTGSELDLGAK